MLNFVPEKMFFTKGVGAHKDRLASFEMALRKAGIQRCNLVSVSSIFPPNCRVLQASHGRKVLKPGQITFTVMARIDTNEPNRLISAAIGLALPKVAMVICPSIIRLVKPPKKPAIMPRI